MLRCNVCGQETSEEVERGQVASNIRAFRQESFGLWRCPGCQSLHASEEVDLAHYYAGYPLHDMSGSPQWMLKAMYGGFLKRLQEHGFDTQQELLDYGCGAGELLSFLREAGYPHVSGFDEYSEAYSDTSVLSKRYDVVISQDVIEHVPEPLELVKTLDGLCKPGGLVLIGTPNAEAIALSNAQYRIQTLHQPYHRHILSKRMLKTLGQDLGWELLRYYPTMYTNTAVPFVNTAFVHHYLRCFDDTLDLAFEPIKIGSWRLWTPLTLWYAFFGCWNAPETDVMAVFRTASQA